MTKAHNKLDRLNIPELFYDRFIANIPRGQIGVVDRLHDTPATKRGRGLTRVLRDLTLTEWNQAYKLAATGRAAMKNADRETTLFPAICAKSLADRMEILGVNNPVSYTPKKTSRRTKVQILEDLVAEAEATDTTVNVPAPVVPIDPPKLNKVSVPESTPDQKQAFYDDIKLG